VSAPSGDRGFRSMLRPGAFAGRAILVTGGGSGIGRCVAHELASLGAEVVLVGRKEDRLEQVRREIVDDGGAASALPCDIRQEEQVVEMVRAALARTERLDGLVNNAGGQFPAPLAAINQKGWETVVRTNLTGGFLVAREVYTQGMSDHGGAIVNVAADMWRGMPGMGHSGAARAGMVNLTKTAAVEWAPSGVRVNAVAPGWIASSGMDSYPDYVKDTIPGLRDKVPLKRLGTEAEVSAVVCFLLSDAAAFLTGVTVPVDGGAPLYPATLEVPDHDQSAAWDPFHRSAIPAFLRAATLRGKDPLR